MSSSVNGIGNTQNYYNQYSNFQNKGKEAEAEELLNPIDTYIPSNVKAADLETLNKLWKETDYAAEAVRKLVYAALGKSDGTGQSFWAGRANNFKLDEAGRAEAQSLIGEDGFFGVTKTTERIMDFAKAMVGENASEDSIENMRDAVQKGFDEVAKMFGGFDKLPDVTKETHEAIMKAFDDWKAGVAAETSA